MTFENYYYSGQGSLYVASRDAGKPAGLVRIGNVPELTIDIATTVFEHTESESGSRLLDLTINKENKSTFSFKLENLSLDNLALGLYGTKASITGTTVVDEEFTMYSGLSATTAFPDISAVTFAAKDGVTAPAFIVSNLYALGAYLRPITPNSHYYKITTAGTTAGTEPTYPTNGGTVTSGGAVLQDMGLINRVVDVDYTLSAKFGMITPVQDLTAGIGIDPGRTYQIDYTYANSNKLDVFTQTAPERWLRFEGLNTVDGSHVLVDIFKAKFDPLTGYGILNEDLGSASMKGTILYDALQLTGSQYFRQVNVAA